jgi:hypothetical protein
MRGNHLFEYATIRLVPRVEREEFINVGIILYCASEGFLQTKFEVNPLKISAFCPETDLYEVTDRLNAFVRVCAGGPAGGPIGQLPIASRFRWLTAARSTIIQTSPVHPGACESAEKTFQRLYAQLVQ